MDYGKACNIVNGTKELKVNAATNEIVVPVGFVMETYTIEVQEAITILSCDYGFTLL